MTIRAILATKGETVVSVSSGDLVSDALKLLAEKRIGAVAGAWLAYFQSVTSSIRWRNQGRRRLMRGLAM
jgi:hypothetical protein